MSGRRRRFPGWRSLRTRLTVLGFLAGYVPVLLLFGVVLATETEVDVHVENGVLTQERISERSPWVTGTVVALGPGAALAAWWWAGRAVRPIERVRAVAEEIEAGGLGRRIGLREGPTEIVALAASFDAMLGRLEASAETQRRLIEETSHELRTPLSVLAANAEVLLARPDPDLEVYRRGLERSGRAAERMRSTIDELLLEARGRARTLDRAPVDLMALVRSVRDETAPLAAARGTELRVTGPAEAVCPVDGVSVRRAVANLVDNALRYGADGSTVLVEVECSASEAAVSVTDHGPGIPEHEQERVFQRFRRGPGRGDDGGSGLGLAIARQTAAAHGGGLGLTSPGPTGDGCVFRLVLQH
ncbi:signal transduction histidine kinase [Nocardiopsis sp. Huas11]|uniref:HAMP domain-containing sensor histidine kinase n=1 Tax=Nocardiopsis sp. Huas11 TaxID=2183912 RepID=UPI000EB09FBF|nr:ATP-binding protein [Nocardiopsis sp. Huas11]RKS10529.1 signal transduction histidine kinase [Nocardiopsis sp. Huas11]